MAEYQLADRKFSRVWRRSKIYQEKELRWRARRYGLVLRPGKQLQIVDPKSNKVVATFNEIAKSETVVKPNPRLEAFAALRVGVILFLAFLALNTHAYTYQERVVAAVLTAEARGEGTRGMTAVAEVISRRAHDKKQTPLAVVRAHVGSVYAFSCLNGVGEQALLARYQSDPVYAEAIVIAHTACTAPTNLPGITHRATHYAHKKLRPRWVTKNQKPVAIIGNHAFWRVQRY